MTFALKPFILFLAGAIAGVSNSIFESLLKNAPNCHSEARRFWSG